MNKHVRALLTALVAVLGAIALAACQPGPENQGQVPLESVEIGLLLSSYARDEGSTTTSSTTSTGETGSETVLEGELRVVSDETGDVQTFQWGIVVSEATLEVPTELTLNLEKGVYDLYLLVDSAGQQYAGMLENWVILEGENVLPMTLYPVVGATDYEAADLEAMAGFTFPYDPDAVSGYEAPSFGLSVDGGPERVFALNVDIWLSELTVYAPEGQYAFDYRFFDALDATEPPPPGVPDPIVIRASRIFHPREHAANRERLPGPVTVRIPGVESVAVESADPEHYVFFLYLGDVTCRYVGRAYRDDAYPYGGAICGDDGPLAGDEVTIEGKVTGKVITGTPHSSTHVSAIIDVLEVQ